MHTALAISLGVLSLYLAIYLPLYLTSLGDRLPTLTFLCRLVASYVALIFVAGYGVVISAIMRVFGQGRSAQWAVARAYQWVMGWAVGVRFVVEPEGEKYLNTRAAVFIANHQSELDVLMLGPVFPKNCAVTAKRSLKRIPILGWFMSLSGTVFIDRANRKTAVAAFDSAAAEMRKYKQSVFIFPEGTRSYFEDADLLPFKKGAFHLAVQAKVPIVPVVVANYSYVLSVHRKRFVKGTIPIRILPPIQTAHLTAEDVEDLTRDTRDTMLKELLSLSEKARIEYTPAGKQKVIKANGDGIAKASGVDRGL